MDLSKLEDTLLGRLHNRPIFNKRIVRVFISSTFTDTKSERDYLIETIFPRLRDHCKKIYNLDFIACDMRWGVPSDAYEYHGTTEFCLKEIERSNKNSIGPTFVTILSHKYGTRFVPNRIQKEEFEIIEREMREIASLAFDYKHANSKADARATHVSFENFLEKCFLLNTNIIPNEYELQPISKIIPQFNSLNKNLKDIGSDIWNALEKRMSKLFRRAAENAFKKGLLSELVKNKYFISTTEKEIYEGIFNVQNPNSKSLCFIREILNQEDLLKSSKSQRFIDLRKDQGKLVVDYEAQDLLEHLKQVKIPKYLDKSNIFHYKIKWTDDSFDEEDLKSYLTEFGETFFREITRLIDEAVRAESEKTLINFESCIRDTRLRLKTSKKPHAKTFKSENNIKNDLKAILQEISTHTKQCEEIIHIFLGRADIISKIKAYVLSDSTIPVTVIGKSGSGKTSVLAKAISLMPMWAQNPSKYIIVYRFLGTTPSASSIFKVYKSIALQLYFIICFFNGSWNEKIYDSYEHANDIDSIVHVIKIEWTTLKQIDSELRVVMVLDSLDQLTPSDFTNLNKWLLVALPKHVKLILSTISDTGTILKSIQSLIKKAFISSVKDTNPYLSSEFERRMKNFPESMEKFAKMRFWCLYEYEKQHYFEVSFLSPKLCIRILNAWLEERKKTLTQNQWDSLNKLLNQASLLSLYLKVIGDIILTWKSYYTPDNEFERCTTIDKCIKYLFKKHEQTHGKVLFRRALFYMTVFRNGISETELEDILTLDDDVLYAVFEFHVPPIQRIPTVLWARLKDDLNEYLVEKEANDTTVIYWYHRRFVEVALNMYVDTLRANENVSLFQNILDFYSDTWKGRKKHLKLNENVLMKLDNGKKESSSDRLVSSQSIEYYTQDGQQHFNKRKLTELPNALVMLNSALSLEKACELVFYNYEFMHAKFKCESLKDIKDDIKKIINSATSWGFELNQSLKSNMNSLKVMQNFLDLCGELISDYPDTYGFQVCSRLMCFYSKLFYLKKLIDECLMLAPRHCAFLSPFTQLPPPGLCTCVINKHVDSIISMLYMKPFVITLSQKRINLLVLQNQLESLFVIDLPVIREAHSCVDGTKLKHGSIKYASDLIVKFKVLSLLNHRDDFSLSLLDNLELSTPDSFPVSFILIAKHSFFIMNPNKQIRFAYECVHEIQDVFCLDQRHLIIIEKGLDSIKFLMNFDLKSRSLIEYSLGSQSVIKMCTSTSSLDFIRGPYHTVTDVCLTFDDDQMRSYSIRVIPNADDSQDTEDELVYASDHLNSDGNQASSFFDTSESESGSEDLLDYIQKRPMKINPHKSSYAILRENIHIKMIERIAPSGVPIHAIFSNPHSIRLLKRSVNKEMEVSPSPKSIYASYEDGTLAIFKSLYAFSQSDCFVFSNLTKQPIIEMKWPLSRTSGFCLAALTQDFAYIIHKNLKSRTKKLKDRQLERKVRNPFSICCLELNEKFNLIQPINEDFFIGVKFNRLILYKIKCFAKNHRTKIVASQVLHNKLITNLELVDNILLSTSQDGVIKTWDITKFKKQKKISFDFDATTNDIKQLYTGRNRVATICKNNEVSIWDVNNGKMIKTLYTSGDVTDVRFSLTQDDIYIIVNYRRLFIYENMQNRIHVDANARSNCKLTFLNRKVLNPKSNDKLFCFDEINSILYQVHFSDKLALKEYSLTEGLNVVDEELELETASKNFFSIVLAKGVFCKIDKMFNYYEIIDANSRKSRKSQIKFDCEHNKDKLKQSISFETIIHLTKNHVMVLMSNFDDQLMGLLLEFDEGFSLEVNQIIENFNHYAYYHSNICIFNKKSSLIQVYRFGEGQEYAIFEIKMDSSIVITHLAIDKLGEYVVSIDNLSISRIYRVRDSKCIGSLPIYDEVIDVKFSSDSKYVCMGLADRRLFVLLIIDPIIPEHTQRIKEVTNRIACATDSIELLGDEVAKNNNESQSDSSNSDEDTQEEHVIDANVKRTHIHIPRNYLMEVPDNEDEKTNLMLNEIQNDTGKKEAHNGLFDYNHLDSTDNQTEILYDPDLIKTDDQSSDDEYAHYNKYSRKDRTRTATRMKSAKIKATFKFKSSVTKVLGTVKQSNERKTKFQSMVKKTVDKKNNQQSSISYFTKKMSKSLIMKFNRRQYELKSNWLKSVYGIIDTNENADEFFRELNQINTKNKQMTQCRNSSNMVKVSNSVVSKGCSLL